MATEFDYDNTDGPDVEVIRSIAADMASAGKPPAMTDAERQEWQSWREQQALLANEQRLESERREAEAEQARLAQERKTAALERAERTRQLQEQQHQQSARQMRDRQLSDLHQASIRNEQFRQGMMRSSAFAVSRQELDSLLTNYMDSKYPPPPPEPNFVVVQEDDGSADLGSRNFDVAKWSKKPRSWWC